MGRKAELTDPPVAFQARAHGLPVFQPETLKDDAVVERLKETVADFFVVVAYGKILPQRVLDIPRVAAVNVHGSVLPRWRGASPVQAALLAGDTSTGVSLMKMEAGMDTGPIYAEATTPILAGETAGELSRRLSMIGADMLIRILSLIARGAVRGEAQDEALATYCPKIRREDGRVDFGKPAEVIERAFRAYTPWPGLFTLRHGVRVKLGGLVVEPGPAGSPAGTVLVAGERIVIACAEGAVAIATLQAEGRRMLPAEEFVRGERVMAGELWGG